MTPKFKVGDIIPYKNIKAEIVIVLSNLLFLGQPRYFLVWGDWEEEEGESMWANEDELTEIK